MESQSFSVQAIIEEILRKLLESCDYIIEWNQDIHSSQDYHISSSTIQTMAASCMLIETIGEGFKSIDKRDPEFLEKNFEDVPWVNFIGRRNIIAHGYLQINARIIFETVKQDIPQLKENLEKFLKKRRLIRIFML